jgi:hypothetical protein
MPFLENWNFTRSLLLGRLRLLQWILLQSFLFLFQKQTEISLVLLFPPAILFSHYPSFYFFPSISSLFFSLTPPPIPSSRSPISFSLRSYLDKNKNSINDAGGDETNCKNEVSRRGATLAPVSGKRKRETMAGIQGLIFVVFIF